MGIENKGVQRIMGIGGEVTRKNNEEKKIQRCLKNDLINNYKREIQTQEHLQTHKDRPQQKKILNNTLFQLKKNHWNYIQDVKVTRQVKLGSDHYLLKIVVENVIERITEKRQAKYEKTRKAKRRKN